ncbi:MAG: DUF1786 domain-containing protein [Deltaproteobacteria bacterium]|nr:DUF1786 domain-containing protein [Deltaproteobacteria bacterium]
MLEGPLLTIDVGGGTQDLFLWQAGQAVENAVKMVVPAPTQIAARRIQRCTSQKAAIFLTGRLMGGGAVSQAVRRHLARGLKAYARPEVALTLHDNLQAVRQWGVILAETAPPEAVEITLGDVDPEVLQKICDTFAIPFPRHFAVAVQDHGFNPGGSNRLFRFQHWERVLAQGSRLADLAYFEPPEYLTRMKAVAATLPGALLMDTCTAGVRGALLEDGARKQRDRGLTVVNLGNAHTFAALIQGDRLLGVYEHHTGLLNSEKLFNHLRRFQAGELTNEEIFSDNGHGCAYAPDYSPGHFFAFTVFTGPQRRLARGWPDGIFAAPFGDMMLTGCFGLADAFFEAKKIPLSLGEPL